MKKAVLIIFVVVFSIVSLTACSSTEQFFVFGTFLDVTAKGSKSTATEIWNYMNDLEKLLSPTVEGSDIYKINNAKAGEVVSCSSDTMSLLRTAKRVFDESDGAYDPSIYPLVKLWGFSGDKFSHVENKVPPTDAEIQETLNLVGFDKAFTIDFSRNTIVKNQGYDGAMLDFGGVAKGYAVGKSMANNHGTEMLINLGGNIGAVKSHYTIGIGNPRESDSAYYGSFTLDKNELISTSGDYERCFFYEGKRYHHILDPRTGKPTNNGLISVSVVCKYGDIGDALSTAIMVLGPDKGRQLIWNMRIGAKAIFIYENLSYELVTDHFEAPLDFQRK